MAARSHLATQLARLRKQHGLSLRDCGKLAGTTAWHIQRLERDAIVAPSVWLLARLAAGLGIPLAELIGPVEPVRTLGQIRAERRPPGRPWPKKIPSA